MTYQVYTLESLGAVTPGSAADPIAAYGDRAAAAVLRAIDGAPSVQRKEALRAALEAIDPKLPGVVVERQARYAKKGVHPQRALQRALSTALSDGVVSELKNVGYRGAPPPRGQLGLGLVITAKQTVIAPRRDGSGTGTKADPYFFFMKRGEVKLVRRTWHGAAGRALMLMPGLRDGYASAIKKAKAKAETLRRRVGPRSSPMYSTYQGRYLKAKAAIPAIEKGELPFATFKNIDDGNKIYGVYYNDKGNGNVTVEKVPPKKSFWDKVKGLAADIGYGITWPARKAAEHGYKAAQKAADAVKDLTCDLVNHPAAGAAAAGAGAGPAGAIGVQVAKAACNGEQAPPTAPLPPPRSGPGWVLPVAIGAAALVGAVVLSKRKP